MALLGGARSFLALLREARGAQGWSRWHGLSGCRARRVDGVQTHGAPFARQRATGLSSTWRFPGPVSPGWLILLVAELKRPPASEVVGEGVELALGSAVCEQNAHMSGSAALN